MPLPEPMNPAVTPHLLAEVLTLQPYVEHILCDGSHDPDVRAAAKDIVQAVLRKAIQHLPSYEPHKEGLRPWLTRIARNEKIDVHRSSKRHANTFGHDLITADFAPSAAPSPERDAQVRALLESVLVFIEEMPPEMRNVLFLSAVDDVSHAEIAAQLDISEAASKMWLVRARKMLRERFGAIRDHVGLWLVLFPRRLGASRVPMPRFLWQASHLLPPIIIGIFALPQLETLPLPTEYAVVAPHVDESALYVHDNRPDVDLDVARRFVFEGRVHATTPHQPVSVDAHASDKPRQRTQPRAFDVVLPPISTLMNDRR